MEQSRNYSIIDFNSESHEITVRFNRFDVVKVIRLLIEDNKYITGIDLDNYIMSHCPIKQTIEKQIATNAEEIKKLISVKYSERLKRTQHKNNNAALRQELLASSDWTQLPDANQNLDDEDRKLWLEYRQDLRDITKQPGWPVDVEWPKRPHILGVTIFE